MSDISELLRARARRTADEHQDAGGLPVETLVTRARRARARRTAWSAGAAAACVAGVALGATALGDDRTSPPPASTPSPSVSPSSSPSSSPSPTPSPVVALPAGDPSLPFGACGSLVTSPPQHPLDGGLLLEAGPLPATAAVGDLLTFEVAMGHETEGVLVRPAAGPRVVVSRDGVVVASTDAYGGLRDTWVDQVTWRGTPVYVAAVDLRVCSDSSQALPPGTYEVRLLGEGAVLENHEYGVAEPPAPPAGSLRSVVSGPWPLTLEERAPAARPARVDVLDPARPPFPEEGAALPPAPTASGPWRLTHTLGPLEASAADLAAGDVIDGSGTIGYVGPGRVTMHTQVVLDLWVVRDGRVVATTYEPSDMYTSVLDIGPDAGTTLDVTPEPFALCDPDCGAELPPGTYTLVPGVVVHGGGLWTPDGTEQRLQDMPTDVRAPWVVLGEPVTLTVR